MSPPPIPCVVRDGAFHPLPNFHNVVAAHYGDGEVVSLVPAEERSGPSHRHYFASLREAWLNLPEDQAARFPSVEALRKFALISTGHRNESSTVCMFKTEARRLAAAMKPLDEFSVVVVNDRVVTRYTAKSQSVPAMRKDEFEQSKQDVLAFVAGLIGVTTEALSHARAA